MHAKLSITSSWQDILENVLLGSCQASWELDIDANDEIATLTRLLGDRHALAGEALLMTRLCWSRLRDANRLAVYRGHDTFPASQGFFESEVDGRNKVVADTFEIGMLELQIER